ncbi:MAG TPA: Cys-tRNA(Pro) deacylase [Bacteroidota bacterium]|nr:Cys-tRNA(Pro) deacylase [Bacteroidota bacterium]
MTTADFPITPAVRVLREKKIPFEPHLYRYVEHGGTLQSAGELGVPEHEVVKTLVLETDHRKPLIVLMHGDREVSLKNLARQLAVKSISMCTSSDGQRFTGYQFGGTSPLGTRIGLPVYAEKSIFDLPKIYLNGGKRGFLIGINPRDLLKVIAVHMVEVGIAPAASGM